jgi:hypothetical protein
LPFNITYSSVDAFVAVFQLNAEAHAIAHAVAAPGAAYAGFRHTQRFGIRVTGFEAGLNQLTPDFRQVIFLGAEQTDTLGTGDFGVEIKFTGDAANCDQTFWSQLLRNKLKSRCWPR